MLNFREIIKPFSALTVYEKKVIDYFYHYRILKMYRF